MPVTGESWLLVYHDFLASEIRELKHYGSVVEKLLHDEAQRVETDVSEQAKMLPEEQRGDFVEWSSEGFFRLKEEFPNILRSSLFVHSYAFFEHALLRLSEQLQALLKLNLSPGDLRDDGITRAKTYLKKVAKLQFPDTGTAWQEICCLNSIRNVIVHKTGFLEDGNPRKPQIEAFISKWSPTLELDDLGRFVFASSFADRVLSCFEAFFNELFGMLKLPAYVNVI